MDGPSTAAPRVPSTVRTDGSSSSGLEAGADEDGLPGPGAASGDDRDPAVRSVTLLVEVMRRHRAAAGPAAAVPPAREGPVPPTSSHPT